MTNTIKNALGVAIIITLFLFAWSAMSYVKTYSNTIDPGSFRSFTASGEGKVVAVPDIARFTFSVITQGGTDIASLQKNNVERTNKVTSFIKSQGVKDEDIKTESYNLIPRYTRCQPIYSPEGLTRECPPAEITGYEIRQTVSVKIRDFGKISTILGGVVDNGANNVSGLNFTIDDTAELQNEARAEAIAKAQARAKETARAAGFRLGKLLSIDDNYYQPIPFYAREEAGFGGDATTTKITPQIEPGSEEIVVNVTLRYAIE